MRDFRNTKSRRLWNARDKQKRTIDATRIVKLQLDVQARRRVAGALLFVSRVSQHSTLAALINQR